MGTPEIWIGYVEIIACSIALRDYDATKKTTIFNFILKMFEYFDIG
jgi:hypothetical protein